MVLLLAVLSATFVCAADPTEKANLIVQKKLIPVNPDFPGLFAVVRHSNHAIGWPCHMSCHVHVTPCHVMPLIDRSLHMIRCMSRDVACVR